MNLHFPKEEKVDHKPSDRQLEQAVWLADDKKLKLPSKCLTSNKALWAWLKDTITRTDRDIANTIAKDFHRTVTLDLDNPYDVIRGLKYDSRVLESEEEAQSEKDLREAAIRMLEEGVSIHVVADYFDKSDDWVFSVAKEAESREVWVNYD